MQYMGAPQLRERGAIPRILFQLAVSLSASDAFALRNAELLWHLLLCLKLTNGVSPQGSGQYYLSILHNSKVPWVSLGHKLKPLVSWPHAAASRSAYVITAWSTWSTSVRAKEFCYSGPVGSTLSRRVCDWVFLHIIYSHVLAMSFLSSQ